MAVDLFNALNGFSVFGKSAVLSGTGVAGGDSSFQDAAKLGSIYLRTDVGKVYTKITSVNTTADWVELPNLTSITSLINTSTNGISWREPADATDNTVYANIAAAVTAANSANTVDTVSLVVGFRALFTNLTSGNKNVYITGGTTGAWTFTEDTNTATNGDEVYVKGGPTGSGTVYVYNGSTWAQTSGANITSELGYVRTFIGKGSAGNVVPSYASTNFVTQNSSLVAAVGAVDTGIITAVGNRVYSSTNVVTSATSATTAIGALDTSLGTANTNITTLQNLTGTASASAVTAATTIDSAICRSFNAVNWMITCVDATTNTNKQAVEVFAIHDGTSITDAVKVDYNVASILSVNTAPAGLTFNVTLSGAGAAQVMNLQVTSTTSVNVKVARTKF